MNKEKRLHAIGLKCSQGLQASMKLCDIILEKFVADILPENLQISIAELNEITIYNYYKLKKYMGNNYYSVGRKTFTVIADNRYLAEQSKTLCKRYVLKLVIATNFDIDSFENRVGKYFRDIDFTAEESAFIDLMLNELLSVTCIKEFSPLSANDLFDFNSLNRNCFYYSAKRVYNDVLQSKLHAGDNIISYLAENLKGYELADRLERAEKYDYFFDNRGILKCDLDTNKNTLIKNFINSVLYKFDDPRSRVTLLQKLNAKYPFLISEKIENEIRNPLADE